MSNAQSREPHPSTILVVGATGALGRLVVARLLDRGARVRVLVRAPERLGALRDRVDVFTADVLSASGIDDAFHGVDAVFSSLGASVQPKLGAGRRSYPRVDAPANMRLVEAARAHAVARFVYVSLLATPRAAATAYVRAHEAVVDALRRTDLDWCALRPTGFHSVFLSMLALADGGRVPFFGDGAARTNPIADDDLARVAVDILLQQAALSDREPALGGPDVLSRREIAALACEVVGRGRTLSLPPWLGRAMAALMWPLSPRMHDLMRFALAVGDEDAIAPVRGQVSLRESLRGAWAGRQQGLLSAA